MLFPFKTKLEELEDQLKLAIESIDSEKVGLIRWKIKKAEVEFLNQFFNVK